MRKVVLSLALISLIAGCATMQSPAPPVEYEPEPGVLVRDQLTYKDKPIFADIDEVKGSRVSEADDSRKVITSASLRLESDQPDSVHLHLMEIAERYDGYILNSETEITTIRLPALNFKAAIEEIETYGKVVGKRISGKDITENYQDIQIRLDNAEKTRQRYLALLDAAVNVQEMLEIERELERINAQIDQMKGSLARMSHLIEYATISVSTSKAIQPGPIGYVFWGLYKGVEWLFVWK